MQAQTAKTKGELLYEVKSKNVTTTIKDIGPSGLQLEMNDRGEVSGKFQGGLLDTISVKLKTDGTSEWQGKSIVTTKDGDMLVAWGGGKGHSTGPQTAVWDGELHFMTQSPKLAHLNNTTAWVEGQGNMATQESTARIYAKK